MSHSTSLCRRLTCRGRARTANQVIVAYAFPNDPVVSMCLSMVVRFVLFLAAAQFLRRRDARSNLDLVRVRLADRSDWLEPPAKTFPSRPIRAVAFVSRFVCRRTQALLSCALSQLKP